MVIPWAKCKGGAAHVVAAPEALTSNKHARNALAQGPKKQGASASQKEGGW